MDVCPEGQTHAHDKPRGFVAGRMPAGMGVALFPCAAVASCRCRAGAGRGNSFAQTLESGGVQHVCCCQQSCCLCRQLVLALQLSVLPDVTQRRKQLRTWAAQQYSP
jgi:hypothetical protein